AVLEVTKPATQDAVDVGDRARQATTVGPLRLRPQGVLELVQAFLPRPVTEARLRPLEVIAQKVKAVLTNVDQPRLGRMQSEPVVYGPLLHQSQGPLRFLRRATQDHEVVRVTYHGQTRRGQQVVERVQIDVGQERADDRSLRCAFFRSPLAQAVQDALSQK